jgi:hypothetical protein
VSASVGPTSTPEHMQMMYRVLFWTVALGAAVAVAQTVDGEIAGRINDRSGEPLPGVRFKSWAPRQDVAERALQRGRCSRQLRTPGWSLVGSTWHCCGQTGVPWIGSSRSYRACSPHQARGS